MTLYGFGLPNPFLAMYRLLGHDYVMPVQSLLTCIAAGSIPA